jgi:hypothetical protein
VPIFFGLCQKGDYCHLCVCILAAKQSCGQLPPMRLYFGCLVKMSTIATYVSIFWPLSKVVGGCHLCVYISRAWPKKHYCHLCVYISAAKHSCGQLPPMSLYFGGLAKKASVATYVSIFWRLSKVVDNCHQCVYNSGAWQLKDIANYVFIFWRLSKVVESCHLCVHISGA